MVSLSEWFEQNRYNGTRQLGERVTGKFHGVRWVGTVGNDRVVNEVDGPEITVTLDLPLSLNGKVHNILIVKSKDIQPLVDMDLIKSAPKKSK